MAEHPIQGLMGVTMDKIRDMVDSNTIVGSPITVEGGTTIIPISKVTFGFASAGSDVGAKANKEMFGGGSGAGVSVTPIAFLVVKEGNVRTVQLSEYVTSVDRAIGMLPELVDKLSALIKKEKPEKAEQTAGPQEPAAE
ncbi:MAG: GerW family sporulation protein [Gemmiger sp.]|nr:GerW family sporulation protein [Gemmiger sp.]